MSKKGTSAWKLLLLITVGLCGIYLCWIGVDYEFPSRAWSRKSVSKHSDNSCSQAVGSNSILHHRKSLAQRRSICSCLPVRNFVILSMQRSGSGWFETLLNSHPNISSHGELFSVKSRRTNFSTIASNLDTVYALSWVSSASKNECTNAVGFKWMLNQGVLDYRKEALAYFHENSMSLIFLLRRNLLKRLVSVLANAYDREMKLLNGTHKAHVHSEEEAETLAAYKPKINTEVLIDHLQRIEDITNNAIQFFNNTRHIILYYEDLVKDTKILDKVLLFLDVPQMKLDSQHVKIHRRPLKDQIENWKDVYDTLKGSKFKHFLKDEDPL